MHKYHEVAFGSSPFLVGAFWKEKRASTVGLNLSQCLEMHTYYVGDIPPGTIRWYMGRTIRGGPSRKIEACTARLQVVLDIVIVPNMILYL